MGLSDCVSAQSGATVVMASSSDNDHPADSVIDGYGGHPSP